MSFNVSSDESSDNLRSEDEIIEAILSAADRGEGTTRLELMGRLFMSHKVTTEYLERLCSEGLLENKPETGKYVTTVQGKKSLRRDSAAG